MYVCVCNAVTERHIYRLVAEGMTTLDEIQAVTGCAGTCGACREHAELVVDDAIRRTACLPQIPIHGALTRPA